jgi:hypothetical protein
MESLLFFQILKTMEWTVIRKDSIKSFDRDQSNKSSRVLQTNEHLFKNVREAYDFTSFPLSKVTPKSIHAALFPEE